MTRELAIKIFNEVLLFGKAHCTQAEFEELAKISIQALEQEPTTKDLTCAYAKGVYDTREETATILDKIRAEIDKARFVDKDTRICKNALASGLEVAIQIIDKYKADRSENDK